MHNHLMRDVQPLLWHRAVVVDVCNVQASSRLKPGIAAMRESLLCFKAISDMGVLSTDVDDVLSRSISRIVINNDDLIGRGCESLFTEASQCSSHEIAAVVGAEHDARQ